MHEWPLSKVELVEINGRKLVLKTIHQDFENEVYKHDALQKICKTVKIPKIYSVKHVNNKVLFLMQYVAGKKKVSNNAALKIIDTFHKETRRVGRKFFTSYDFKHFYADFNNIKQYLKQEIGEMSEKELKKFFKPVFTSKKSIVHGDWGKDQILGKPGEYYIVDFGKSFYGPAILDNAFLFLKDKKKASKLLAKAKIVAGIITLAWLELCRTKYVDYDYKKEIKKYSDIINWNYKRVK